MVTQNVLSATNKPTNIESTWDDIINQLSREVSKNVIDKFIKPLKPVSLENDKATIAAPGAFIHEWVQEKYFSLIQNSIKENFGSQVKLDLILDQSIQKKKKTEPPQQALIFKKQSSLIDHNSPYAPDPFEPNDKYLFDNFIIGQSNRLAYAGARSVSKAPGKKYNPLFIYGDSGLGKTHLLHSIAHDILKGDPEYPIVYLSAQQFAERFVHALQNNKIDQFRKVLRSIGVWLVDDIQFIAGKDKTQEEIFHTFNYMHGLGKQIVLCSDRPPKDLYLMDERLRSRFESGLVADIAAPDTETRCAILLSKAKQEHIQLDHDIAMLLAEAVPGNIRILEGALIKLAAQASICDTDITIELAKDIIDRYYRQYQLPKPNVDQILDLVSNHFRIPIEELKGASRKAPITHARHVAIYMIREISGDSWKHLGSIFGNRDHTSMMHAHQKIQEKITTDKQLENTINSFKQNFRLAD